ncbi:hypothetical protein AMJ71_10865 [candidate division TA06 bacterium SM1_40]|nr:MAG: hypothetical protein AMJ71_10865 [candidate division TA06 bacterium SM1_40]
MAGSWMTANQATYFGVAFILLAALGLYVGLSYEHLGWVLLLVPLFLVMRLAMNTLDGMLSREYNTATPAGEVWNESLDIGGDTICYGVLFFVPDGPALSLTIFLILIWAAEFYGVLGKSLPGGVRRHESLGGGKPDRAVWVGLFAIIAFFNHDFIHYLPHYLAGVSILVGLTCIRRIAKILEVARGEEYKSYTWIGR